MEYNSHLYLRVTVRRTEHLLGHPGFLPELDKVEHILSYQSSRRVAWAGTCQTSSVISVLLHPASIVAFAGCVVHVGRSIQGYLFETETPVPSVGGCLMSTGQMEISRIGISSHKMSNAAEHDKE